MIGRWAWACLTNHAGGLGNERLRQREKKEQEEPGGTGAVEQGRHDIFRKTRRGTERGQGTERRGEREKKQK